MQWCTQMCVAKASGTVCIYEVRPFKSIFTHKNILFRFSNHVKSPKMNIKIGHGCYAC